MNTFIISSKNLKKAQDYVQKICEQAGINKFDRQILMFEKALGIEDVRNIQKKIFLKPLRGKKKAVVIELTFGATIEAQNSMLKLLEEPPKSTLIFIITNNALFLLPTVLSRGKLIEIKNEEVEIKEDGLNKILALKGAGERLWLAQSISGDKNEAILWLESAILATRDRMLKSLNDKEESLILRKLIHKLELTHYDLKTTNVNPRLALENLFLNI